jgi:hypothetical protein
MFQEPPRHPGAEQALCFVKYQRGRYLGIYNLIEPHLDYFIT